jgi:putative aldouronate transport system substrate-binding protein
MQDEWREALRFINGLVADKLIADVSFTQTQDEAYAIMKNPDITLVGTAVMPSPSSLAPDDTRRVEYITGYPLKKDANSKAVSIQKPAVPSYSGFITKNCEFPETAFRVFDTMLSDEMTMHNRWGEHGTDWTDPNPGDKGAYDELGYPAMLYPVLVWGSVQNSHWSGVAPDWRDYGPAAGMIVDYSNLMVSSFTLECAKSDIFQIAHKPDEVVFKIVYTGEEMDELSELEATITTYVKEARAEFAMGISSLDTGWDAYIAELKKMGVERYLEIVQTAYSRMMGG